MIILIWQRRCGALRGRGACNAIRGTWRALPCVSRSTISPPGDSCRNIKANQIKYKEIDAIRVETKTASLQSCDGGIGIRYEAVNDSEVPMSGVWAGRCIIDAPRGGKILSSFEKSESVDDLFNFCDKFHLKTARTALTEAVFAIVWRRRWTVWEDL